MITAFPEIRKEVLDEDYEGLITLQVGCLTHYTQKAIDNEDWATVARSFLFVDENIDKVSSRIENSLGISYLGKLNIKESSAARRLLSPKLLVIYNQFVKYYDSL